MHAPFKDRVIGGRVKLLGRHSSGRERTYQTQVNHQSTDVECIGPKRSLGWPMHPELRSGASRWTPSAFGEILNVVTKTP